jgi:hypothetical protein
VSRVYQEETAQNCETVTIGRQQVIADIGNPDVSPAPPGDQDGNPSTPDNPSQDQEGYDPLADPGLAAGARYGTFFVEPGGRAQVTLRVWGIDAVGENPEFRNRVWMKVYAQAANTTGETGVAFDIACGTGTESCAEPDVTAPEFSPSPDPDFILNNPQPANVLFIEANAPGGWKPPTDFTPPAVVDASSVEVVCVDNATGIDVLQLTSPIPVGPASVVCTATDAAGNVSEPVEYDFVVLDDVPPEVTLALPPGLEGGLEATNPVGEVVTFGATAFDDVNGPTAVTCDFPSGSRFPIGTTTVTCSASDSPPIPIPGTDPQEFTNDEVGTAVFTVTVRDSTAPVVTVPANISAEATGAAGRVVTFSASATDVVSGLITPVCTPASGSTFALGTSTVTCTATDGAGNASSGTFTVTVTDTTRPVVTPPADVVAEATGPGGATVSYPAATAIDLVGGTLAAPCVPASGSTFAIGPTTVTCTATDAVGNTGSATFTVTVRDTTRPVVTVPAPITVTTTGTTATVAYTVTASDAVGVATLGCSAAGASNVTTTGGTFPVGTSTVNCAATDAAGNSASASFTVTVNRAGYGGLDGVYANGSKSATSAVPLDFGFIGLGSSARVDSSLAAPSVKVYYAGRSCPGVKPASPTRTYPSGSSDYRYSASSQNWQFNWKPSVNRLGAGCYYVAVKSDQTGQEFESTRGPITLTK